MGQELVETESSFVGSMKALCEGIIEPIQRLGRDPDVRQLAQNPLVAVFFSHAMQIYHLNSKLSFHLEQRLAEWSSTQTVGDLLAEFGPLFKLFSLYARNHSAALVYISHLRRSNGVIQDLILNLLEDPGCKNQALESLLIAPIQRVPRYLLLLKELLKQTPPNHADVILIYRAIGCVKISAEHINEMIRLREQTEELLQLESKFKGNIELAAPGRRLVKHGALRRRTRSGWKVVYFHLFNDIMLYSVKNSISGTYQVHRRIELSTSNVELIPHSDDCPYCFQVTNTAKSFIVQTADEKEQKEWFDSIHQGVSESATQDISDVMVAPVWMIDSASSKCGLCKDKFSVIKRKHHCRLCGNLVCSSCSNHRQHIEHLGRNPVRVCDECLANSDSLGSAYIEIPVLPAADISRNSSSPAFNPSKRTETGERDKGVLEKKKSLKDRFFGNARSPRSHAATTLDVQDDSATLTSAGAFAGNEARDSSWATASTVTGSFAGNDRDSTMLSPATASAVTEVQLAGSSAHPAAERMTICEDEDRESKLLEEMAEADARFGIANKLYKLECEFVDLLAVLIEVFINPLLSAMRHKRGSTTLLDIPIDAPVAVFLNNFEPIFTLAEELKKAMFMCVRVKPFWDKDQGRALGELFERYAPLFSIYSFYARFQVSAASSLESKLAHIIAEKEKDPACVGKSLRKFLNAPLTRVNHYVFHLEKLLSATAPTHPSYKALQGGVKAVQAERHKINEVVVVGYNQQKMRDVEAMFEGNQFQDLQDNPDRCLIKEGPLTRVTTKGPKKYYFHLFTDILIYSYKKMLHTKGPDAFRYELRQQFSLESIQIADHGNTEREPFAFQIKTPLKSFVCCCEDQQAKDAWMVALAEWSTRTKMEKIVDIEDPESTYNVFAAPVWTQNLRSKACSLCDVPFGALKRRHHCRCCGMLVCNGCSPKKRFLANIDPSHALRVCTPCSELPEDKLHLAARIMADRWDSRKKAEQVADKQEEKVLERLDKSFCGTIPPSLMDKRRKLLREGPLTRFTREGGKLYYFHLFDDLLLYSYKVVTSDLLVNAKKPGAKEVEAPWGVSTEPGSAHASGPLEKKITEKKYELRRRIDLAYVNVEDPGAAFGKPFAFYVLTPDKSFACVATTENEKMEWYTDLQNAVAATRKERGLEGMPDDLAPVWVTNSSTTACVICNAGFTVLKRRHHCRRCGKCVCAKCSNYKAILKNIDAKKPQRVCAICKDKAVLSDDKSDVMTTNARDHYTFDHDDNEEEYEDL